MKIVILYYNGDPSTQAFNSLEIKGTYVALAI